jgi:hypothetical protein
MPTGKDYFRGKFASIYFLPGLVEDAAEYARLSLYAKVTSRMNLATGQTGKAQFLNNLNRLQRCPLEWVLAAGERSPEA